ncbi:MAG TPA: hypothetical protein VLY85_02155 [Thermoplasmata archaeon]|nr:hypothetical protein [Thermoplasmata archaeon]
MIDARSRGLPLALLPMAEERANEPDLPIAYVPREMLSRYAKVALSGASFEEVRP